MNRVLGEVFPIPPQLQHKHRLGPQALRDIQAAVERIVDVPVGIEILNNFRLPEEAILHNFRLPEEM